MLKRLPYLCVALFTLAACSNNNSDTSSTTPAAAGTAAPASTAPAAASSAAPAAAKTAPAPASSAPASSASTPPAAAATTAAATPAAAPADNGKWVEGTNYFLIEPAQSKVTNTDKVEVVEAFSYGCPACNLFHPIADNLAKSLPSNAVMVYLPVSFNPAENFPMFQRAYYTAETMGVAEKSHDALFDAVWKSGELSSEKPDGGLKPASALPTIDDAAKVYAKFGADPKEFVATANSFAINTKMKRADELIKNYQVDQTPTLIVDGKYRFTTGSAGGYQQAIDLTKWLVAKEAAGK